MNGELAQVIALATYGTAWLREPDGAPPQLDLTNSAFEFLRSLQFTVDEPRRLFRRRERIVIGGVAGWLRSLERKGVSRLWLVIPEQSATQLDGQATHEHILIAFAGAGTWLLLEGGGPHRDLWRGTWDVGDGGGQDNRIWDVRYEAVAQRGVEPPQPSIASAGQALRAALAEIEAFAAEQQLSPWTEWFTRARCALDSADDEPPYHSDMLPAAYPPDARRLLAAAAQSWVFGGMGSWNDLGFGTEATGDRYHQLSRQLYSTMLTAFVAGVNTELEPHSHSVRAR